MENSIAGAYILSDESHSQNSNIFAALHARSGKKFRILKVRKNKFQQDSNTWKVMSQSKTNSRFVLLQFEEKFVSRTFLSLSYQCVLFHESPSL
jgi:hypothetical protein